MKNTPVIATGSETQEVERESILSALSKFIESGPGLDSRDYGDYASYRSEQRSITRDLQDARYLLRQVEWHDFSVTSDILKNAFAAFSGRLSWNGRELDYTTGQYYPVEYRKAACAVLARALMIQAPCFGDDCQQWKKKNFPRGIASRWF